MTQKFTENDLEERRLQILKEARWCFLNFGYDKTSLEDIAKRAGLSRTLLYKTFKNKEEIYLAVYQDWLISRHPFAVEVVQTNISSFDKLFKICKIMVLEPWADMVDTPMGSEFFNACERLDPDAGAKHRNLVLECVAEVVGSKEVAEVFVLCLDGLLTDKPTSKSLEKRMLVLSKQFSVK